MSYAFPSGGLPDQSQDPEGKAIFTEAYAIIPHSVQTDIVTSFLPGFVGARTWILARPLSGFAETFAQYAVELAPEGGCSEPEPDVDAQAIVFVAKGLLHLTIGEDLHVLRPGGFAYVPPGARWSIWNRSESPCGFHWIRKKHFFSRGVSMPKAFVTHESDVEKVSMPGCDGAWATQRFFDPLDLSYDCHVNIVNFQPGARIPFAETHVMEHGLYVLEGTGEYLLNKDWVTVGPGDFMWLRAFCPQACIATGDRPFRYLLYKDVNRHVPL